jgi:hypothetical protein
MSNWRVLLSYSAFISLLIVTPSCTSITSEDPSDTTQLPSSAANPSEQSSAISTIASAVPSNEPSRSSLSLTVHRDIVYATSRTENGDIDTSWTLDIYVPDQSDGWPVALLLHGLGANKNGYREASEAIAKYGAIVYVANYPIRVPDAGPLTDKVLREAYETITCAFGYIQKSSSGHGGDPDKFVLISHSWGALYGSWIALGSDTLVERWQEYDADHGAPATKVECIEESVLYQVDAFIGIGGGHYDGAEVLEGHNPGLWSIASPYSYFGQALDMKIALLHGDDDPTASFDSSKTFNDVLLDAGYDSRLIPFEGGHIVPPKLTFNAIQALTDK